ncbi:thermonuclease family protein [Culicoidibacter larvae]|uniref:Thermonuclease family protein n=1 Tax=Culicoidibacter larvae TaxID=2579976 RepID=A0A5R8QAQ1_9FIRM|nr:thermonuclease family protein [Culicoidibacter larvae]TLG72973.1 thermonuclease family protein [Culicoidibacter larvae]
MKNKKLIAALIVAVLGVAGFTVSQTEVHSIVQQFFDTNTVTTPATPQQPSVPTESLDENGRELVAFEKCVDGDTFWVVSKDNGSFKIRLSGVNTPESTNKKEFYGNEASAYTCERIQEAQVIALEYDTTQKDSYNRKVVIVWLDNQNFNLELVTKGYADLKYLKDTMPYAEQYRAAEAEAKAAGLGMWNKS